MFKKYYDNNHYLVGMSFGDITHVEQETTEEDYNKAFSLLRNIPKKEGYISHLLEESAADFHAYSYIFDKIPEAELSDEALINLFHDQIINSVVINTRPAAKEGYTLKPQLNSNIIYWVFEKIPTEADYGTYINPIPYTIGMEVVHAKWYTDGDDVWEAIADGIPADFTDTNYFDIITI